MGAENEAVSEGGLRPKRRRAKKEPPKDPCVGFLCFELLDGGDVRTTCQWRTEVGFTPALLGQLAFLAQQVARGRLNDHFARTARRMGEAVGQKWVGDEVAAQFEAFSPTLPCVRPTHVFHQGNGRRPPMLSPGS
jgi:hypothetical protein